MKNLLLLICLSISFQLLGQPTYKKLKNELDEMIQHAQENSLYREKVNWLLIKKEMYQLSKEAKTIADLSPSLKYMLKELGDDHGRIYHNNRPIAYYSSGLKEHHETFSSDIYNEIQQGQTYFFKAELLEKKIGYIRIVGMPVGDNQKMAKGIQDKVCELAQKGAKEWIIDLRYNGGGNMHPMAEGIAAIIGDGKVGGTSGLTDSESHLWKVVQGDFYYGNFSIQLENDCSLEKDTKVAVLTSVYTASSGEVIAVIFKGRENTKFFGEKTIGMITATDWKVINDNTFMTISVSYYKDRLGNVYKNYVDVDENIAFSPEKNLSTDEGVKTAIKWLNN